MNVSLKDLTVGANEVLTLTAFNMTSEIVAMEIGHIALTADEGFLECHHF